MYIFIDESGDLGFDFSKHGCSKYFTITLLVCESEETVKTIKYAVLKTLKRKINHAQKKKIEQELKGAYTPIDIKRYFFNKMPVNGWNLYAITVNKLKVRPHLQSKAGKNKLYNFLTKKLLETLKISQSVESVSIIIDKSKGSADREDFNAYIKAHLETTFALGTQIYITHENSVKNAGIQAVDMFCWGIQQYISTENDEWLKLYKSKIAKHVRFFW